MTLVSMPVVFPAEEIGAGARWTVDSRVTGDNNLLQTATYTVKKMEEDSVELGVEVAQRPSLGALDFEGGTLDVLSSTSESSGTVTVDLGAPLPRSGDVQVSTMVVYGTAESPNSVVQTLQTGLTWAE